MVLPTKRKPRRRRSLLIASDSGVLAGTSRIDGHCSALGGRRRTPDVFVERAEFLLHFEKRFRVLNGRIDLQAVADDASVGQQALRFASP